MIVITAKEIVGVVSIVLLIGIVIFGLIVDWIRKQNEKVQKIIWGIGIYDKEINKKNRTFLAGKGDKRGEK